MSVFFSSSSSSFSSSSLSSCFFFGFACVFHADRVFFSHFSRFRFFFAFPPLTSRHAKRFHTRGFDRSAAAVRIVNNGSRKSDSLTDNVNDATSSKP